MFGQREERAGAKLDTKDGSFFQPHRGFHRNCAPCAHRFSLCATSVIFDACLTLPCLVTRVFLSTTPEAASSTTSCPRAPPPPWSSGREFACRFAPGPLSARSSH